ncbi:hypothetical protein [Actimicrobium antarcticum]|uniref:Uncharacterized protein n=1 Tax=Actimicrobium antarcticum TaxID=1051899 RepID=A0ABP7TNT1_9BURK
MTEQERLRRNAARLLELYPSFSKRVKRMLEDLESRGLHPRLQDAWRTPEDQLRAYRDGYSKLKFGFHNVTGPDGEPAALAVDVLDNSTPSSPSTAFLLQLSDAAEKAGLHSGIRWGLPSRLAAAIDRAIAANDWQARIKPGWDPSHIETTEVTVAQARSGRRPTELPNGSDPNQIERA